MYILYIKYLIEISRTGKYSRSLKYWHWIKVNTNTMLKFFWHHPYKVYKEDFFNGVGTFHVHVFFYDNKYSHLLLSLMVCNIDYGIYTPKVSGRMKLYFPVQISFHFFHSLPRAKCSSYGIFNVSTLDYKYHILYIFQASIIVSFLFNTYFIYF